MLLLPLIMASLAAAGTTSIREARYNEATNRLGTRMVRRFARSGLVGALDAAAGRFGPEGARRANEVLVRQGVEIGEAPTRWDRFVPWLSRWGQAGITLQDFPDLQLVADWADAERIDVFPLSLAEAARRAERWHPAPPADGNEWAAWLDRTGRFFREHGRGPLQGAVLDRDEVSGLTLQDLTTRPMLIEEGTLMNHCVGRFLSYWQQVEAGNKKIYSIRNAKGWPICTLDLGRVTRDRRNEWTLVQEKGPTNIVPDPSTNVLRSRLAARLQDEVDRAAAARRAAMTEEQIRLSTGIEVHRWDDGWSLWQMTTEYAAEVEEDGLKAGVFNHGLSSYREHSVYSTWPPPESQLGYVLRDANGQSRIHLALGPDQGKTRLDTPIPARSDQPRTTLPGFDDQVYGYQGAGGRHPDPDEATHLVDFFSTCLAPSVTVHLFNENLLPAIRRGTRAFSWMLQDPIRACAWALTVERQAADDTRAASIAFRLGEGPNQVSPHATKHYDPSEVHVNVLDPVEEGMEQNRPVKVTWQRDRALAYAAETGEGLHPATWAVIFGQVKTRDAAYTANVLKWFPHLVGNADVLSAFQGQGQELIAIIQTARATTADAEINRRYLGVGRLSDPVMAATFLSLTRGRAIRDILLTSAEGAVAWADVLGRVDASVMAAFDPWNGGALKGAATGVQRDAARDLWRKYGVDPHVRRHAGVRYLRAPEAIYTGIHSGSLIAKYPKKWEDHQKLQAAVTTLSVALPSTLELLMKKGRKDLVESWVKWSRTWMTRGWQIGESVLADLMAETRALTPGFMPCWTAQQWVYPLTGQVTPLLTPRSMPPSYVWMPLVSFAGERGGSGIQFTPIGSSKDAVDLAGGRAGRPFGVDELGQTIRTWSNKHVQKVMARMELNDPTKLMENLSAVWVGATSLDAVEGTGAPLYVGVDPGKTPVLGVVPWVLPNAAVGWILIYDARQIAILGSAMGDIGIRPALTVPPTKPVRGR